MSTETPFQDAIEVTARRILSHPADIVHPISVFLNVAREAGWVLVRAEDCAAGAVQMAPWLQEEALNARRSGDIEDGYIRFNPDE